MLATGRATKTIDEKNRRHWLEWTRRTHERDNRERKRERKRNRIIETVPFCVKVTQNRFHDKKRKTQAFLFAHPPSKAFHTLKFSRFFRAGNLILISPDARIFRAGRTDGRSVGRSSVTAPNEREVCLHRGYKMKRMEDKKRKSCRMRWSGSRWGHAKRPIPIDMISGRSGASSE